MHGKFYTPNLQLTPRQQSPHNALAGPKTYRPNNLRPYPKNLHPRHPRLAHPVLYIASVEEWDAQPETIADGCIGRGQSGSRPADEM